MVVDCSKAHSSSVLCLKYSKCRLMAYFVVTSFYFFALYVCDLQFHCNIKKECNTKDQSIACMDSSDEYIVGLYIHYNKKAIWFLCMMETLVIKLTDLIYKVQRTSEKVSCMHAWIYITDRCWDHCALHEYSYQDLSQSIIKAVSFFATPPAPSQVDRYVQWYFVNFVFLRLGSSFARV